MNSHLPPFVVQFRMPQAARWLVCLTALLSVPVLPQMAQDGHKQQRYSHSYGPQSLTFEPVAGRTSALGYHAQGLNFSVLLSGSEPELSLGQSSQFLDGSIGTGIGGAKPFADKSAAVTVKLRPLHNRAPARGEDELATRVNYLIGSDESKWKTDVPTYSRVRYSGVYPGIDLVYYGTRQQVEFDFDVSAGADPHDIQMEFRGAHRLALDRDGNLRISTGTSSVLLRKPHVYQDTGAERRQVRARFRLVGRRVIGFSVGRYDHRKPLVIDPVLNYSTYLGVASGGSANAVAVDAAGNAYVTGTYGVDFPITAGALQAQYTGRYGIAFITKFDPNGNVVYSTYLGGSFMDGGRAIAVDSSGNAYVAGYTASTDFPVTSGAYQTVNKVVSQPDFRQFTGFVTKLDPTGSKLVYSTFLGGSISDNPAPQTEGQEQATSIKVDSAGDAWVAGFTFSTDFPTTPTAVQTTNPAAGVQGTANFLTKIDATGSSLKYSTYFAEEGSPPAIALDSSGSVYITGNSNSATFPTTPGVYLSGGSGVDAGSYVAKFGPDGGAPIYSTLVGTATEGAIFKAIAVDNAGNAFVTGHAGDFPTTAGVIDPNPAGGIVVKMNPTGTALVYSTGLGFSPDADGNTIAVDSSGNAYVAGMMGVGTFPLTPGALQSEVYSLENGVAGSFVAKLNSMATAVDYATYLNGFGSNPSNAYNCDCINGGALDPSGNFIVVGEAASVDFPTTPGAFQTMAFNFDWNASAGFRLPFVTKFNASEMTSLPLTSMDVSVNANPQYRESNVVFTAKLTPQSGTGVPTGSVEFSSSYGPLCNVPVDSSGAAICTTGLLPAGDNLVRVSYYGDQGDSAVTQTGIETIKGIPTTSSLAESQSSVLFGTPVTLTAAVKANLGTGIPTGVVIFTVDCSNSNDGFVSLDSTGHASCLTSTDVPVGTHNISVIYTGDENYAQSTSSTVPLTIQPLGVTPAPTFNPPAGTYSQTLSTTIADSNPNAAVYYTTDGSVPTVQFGSPYAAPISVYQSETISAIAIAPGYTSSNVSSVAYNLPSTFSLGLAPISLSVSSSQSATATVTVLPAFGFGGQVSFSCSGLPAGTACSFSPATVTATPQQWVTSTMTISGGKSSAFLQVPPSGWWRFTSLAIIFGAFGLGLRRRRSPYFMIVLLSSGVLLVSACGGGASGTSPNTPITAAVKVTGTSGSIQSSANLTVTYTP